MPTANAPLTNGANGDRRDSGGRFGAGNRAAAGRSRPHAARVAALRSAMLVAVTPEAITTAVEALVREAEAGNVGAAKELLDRAVGRPIESDLLERIEAIEGQLGDKQ